MENKLIDKIIYKLFEEKLLKRYLYVLIALFISAITYNLLMYPAKIVAGGGNGLSIIIESLFHIKPAVFIWFFSITILIVAIFIIGIQKSSGAILSAFVYPIFVDLTSGITTIISINENDMVLISLFAGVMCGWTSGILYKMGLSGGGISLISKIIYEKLHISISKSSFCMNMIIVIIGGLLYGLETIMYAVILLYVDRLIVDRVLLGISKNKIFYIITSRDQEVKEFLLKNVGHGITEFEVVGGYNDNNDQAIMTVVPTKEYFKVTEGIKLIDEKAFFVVTDSYEMSNGS